MGSQLTVGGGPTHGKRRRTHGRWFGHLILVANVLVQGIFRNRELKREPTLPHLVERPWPGRDDLGRGWGHECTRDSTRMNPT